MLKIEVTRKDFSKRDVTILFDRNTKKYGYVNLTTEHICACRFDTVDAALCDLLKDDNVIEFRVKK